MPLQPWQVGDTLTVEDETPGAVLADPTTPIIFCFNLADDATPAAINFTLPNFGIRVIDAWAAKTAGNGGAGDTVLVGAGASPITDAMVLNIVDTTVVRAGVINDANHEIAAGGTLRLTQAYNTNNACLVYVSAVRT